MSTHEKSLILIKPDAMKRRLAGEVIARIYRKGYDITQMRMLTLTKELAEKHYSVHKGKPFFESLLEFITSGPVIAMQVEGDRAIAGMRRMVGATDPFEAAPGTLRGDFALLKGENIIHASDSVESADYELSIYF